MLRALPVRRIAVIKLRAIGDVILTLPVFQNLRDTFPDARIDAVTEAPSSGILAECPFIDNVIVAPKTMLGILGTFNTLRRARYDLAIDLFCNPRSAQLCFATRARYRVGYPFRGRGYAYNVWIESRSDAIHNVDFNLDGLRRIGVPITSRSLSWSPPDDAVDRMKILLSRIRSRPSIIALNASGTWETKRWGLEHFASLADRLIEQYKVDVLLLWGPNERGDALRIAELMKRQPLIAPATTLVELGALLSLCSFMISTDSGPMHLAAAVGIPTLGIFGPTNPLLQGPFNESSAFVRREGLDCLACNLTKCKIGNVCMTELDVDAVMHAFERLYRTTQTDSISA